MTKIVNSLYFGMFQNKRTTQKERNIIVLLTVGFFVGSALIILSL